MKTKLLKMILAVVLFLSFATLLFADTYVKGYTRKDGTYVQPHYRSNPNSTVTDNYSFKGNANPYTGQQGTNPYKQSPSSPYYNGTPRYK
jgi:hypothetical protein